MIGVAAQVALYSNVRSLEKTTPQERQIVGMAGIAHSTATQKPAVIASALKFLKAYQADPGCALPCIYQPFGTGRSPFMFMTLPSFCWTSHHLPITSLGLLLKRMQYSLAVSQCRCSLTLHVPGAGLRTLALKLPSASCCWVTGQGRSARWASRLAQQPVMTHLLMTASLSSSRCAALWPLPNLLVVFT